MLSILLLSSSIGVILGYLITAQMIKQDKPDAKYTWQWTLFVEAFSMIVLIVILVFTPKRYLNLKGDSSNSDTTEF